MKVLLTGATGFIGRYVLDLLQQDKIESVTVGRTFPIGSQGEFIQADLLKLEDIPAVVNKASASHLLHLAWYAEHGHYWASPLNLRWVEASVRLVEAFCAAGGQKVVVSGTCAEYDWASGYCREDVTSLNPATLYGVAKDATRRLVMAICQANQAPLAWGRIFLPYGRGENPQRLIPSLFDVFQGSRSPFGVNANAYRDLLHVEDVASAFVQLLGDSAEGNYNISSGQPTQLAEVVRLIAKSCNGDPDSILALSTSRPNEPELLVGENHKLRALGWTPQHSLAAIGAY